MAPALPLRSLEEFWNMCHFSVVNHSVLFGVWSNRHRSGLIEWKGFYTVTGNGGRDGILELVLGEEAPERWRGGSEQRGSKTSL